jgi:hypothetical protein
MIEIKWPEGIYPLLGGVGMSGTERTELTESTESTELTEQTEHPERTEPPECTDAHRSGLHTTGSFQIANFEEAVNAALPRSLHQNHEALFLLARALKALEANTGTKMTQNNLKHAFALWHPKAAPFLRAGLSRDDYYFEFLEAFKNAKIPLGSDVVSVAWNLVKGKEPPAEALEFESTEVRQLMRHSFFRAAAFRPCLGLSLTPSRRSGYAVSAQRVFSQ